LELYEQLAKELGIALWQVKNTVELIEGGATIPFIARYRKEVTGSLDDNVLRDLSTRLAYLQNLEKRKAEVIAGIEAQELLTEELRRQILAAGTLVEVEDLYRPYRPKRKTRASVARARGLEPVQRQGDAVHHRHLDVHHDEVRLQPFDQLDRLKAVASAADHGEASVPLEHGLECVEKRLVVFGDDDPM